VQRLQLLGDCRLHCETWLERPAEAPATTPEYARRGKCSGNVVGFALPTSERGRMCCRKKGEGTGGTMGDGKRAREAEREGNVSEKRKRGD